MAVLRHPLGKGHFIGQFALDVDTGLSSSPKSLPSKYFYDAAGDELFVKIMHMPEYYLTNAELEIFSTRTDDIIEALEVRPDRYFQLIELGAGDGMKTKSLLRRLMERQFDLGYFPVDISGHALTELQTALEKELPELTVHRQQGDYFEIMDALKRSNHPQVVLFLGSSIGNMDDMLAGDFIYGLGANLHRGDKLLLGMDLIKGRDIVLPAYNDAAGITRAFNLNLLTRINRELGGTFDVEAFRHAPEYDEEEGIAKSFLESLREQEVYIAASGNSYHFAEGEKIHTEISRKYTDAILAKIIDQTDFSVKAKLCDSRNYFADYVLERR